MPATLLHAGAREAGQGRAMRGQPRFLPMSREEMTALGWDALDVLLVAGDAYVDHPSFGTALLGRWLVAHGFRVGVAAQPGLNERERALKALEAFGRPLLFAGVTAGAIDSMLAHYTAFRKLRRDDAYTPGGRAGARPNRAVIAYTGFVRQAFPGLPVVIGGIEASLRRAAHYDFWSDSLRRPILQDSKADILVYGMGEQALLSIARKAKELLDAQPFCPEGPAPLSRLALAEACAAIPGSGWMGEPEQVRARLRAAGAQAVLELPSYEDMQREPALLMRATLAIEKQVHQGTAYALQASGARLLALAPPSPPLAGADLDFLYSLPYSRLPHPSYTEAIPAWEMIRTSITTHRGCGGGCSFCSLALHQGRHVASRSRESILREAARIAKGPHASGAPARWAGSISDVGGPSANMWRATCALPEGKACARPSCLHPAVCPFFQVNQGEGVALLRGIASLPGVRNVRVASGVRFDLALADAEALKAYTSEFTGGQLKVAPEHSEDAVLALMRKPSLPVFEDFLAAFSRHSSGAGKEQYTVPYLMSAFPGCTAEHMRALGAWLRRKNWSPRQVQCFIPTPGTVATAMFYAGISPDGEALYVAKSDKDRLAQHHLLLGSGEGEKGRGRPEGAGRKRTERHKRGKEKPSGKNG